LRFLLDQSADARLIPHLRAQGHDATRIGREHPHGLPDERVLRIAYEEQRILIATDLDFGDLIVRMRQLHVDRLDRFFVITPQSIRVRD
jgi:predicted nuclease of predicted toxin-antitoxin system